MLAGLAACGGGGSGGGLSPTDPGNPSEALVEALSLELVNEARRDAGLGLLLGDAAIAEVARRHSEAMRDRGFFAHDDPEGMTFADRLHAAGIGFREAGENLAQVTDAPNPAAFAHDRLIQNPEHRANILNGNFDAGGVGVARRGSSYWITQVFVRR